MGIASLHPSYGSYGYGSYGSLLYLQDSARVDLEIAPGDFVRELPSIPSFRP